MQAEKENLALEKLSALMPQRGASVLVAALKESQFEVDPAVTLLRRFSTEHEERLKALQKVRYWMYLGLEYGEAFHEANRTLLMFTPPQKRSKLKHQIKEAEEAAVAAIDASDESSSGTSSDSSSDDSDSDSDRKVWMCGVLTRGFQGFESKRNQIPAMCRGGEIRSTRRRSMGREVVGRTIRRKGRRRRRTVGVPPRTGSRTLETILGNTA